MCASGSRRRATAQGPEADVVSGPMFMRRVKSRNATRALALLIRGPAIQISTAAAVEELARVGFTLVEDRWHGEAARD